jgi:hypothetical protein
MKAIVNNFGKSEVLKWAVFGLHVGTATQKGARLKARYRSSWGQTEGSWPPFPKASRFAWIGAHGHFCVWWMRPEGSHKGSNF